MDFARTAKALVVCLAVVGFCMPQPLWAAVQADRSSVMADVALQQAPQGRVLVGRVVDQQGAGQADSAVTLYSNGKKVAEAKTDGKGVFVFHGLRGGVYQMTVGQSVLALRVWTPGAAPPSAQPGALIVAGQEVVRGQRHPFGHGFGRAKFWLSHPLVIAGIVATAVAIPVALHNADDDDGPKSK